LVPRSGWVKNQLILTQPEEEEAATARTGEPGNLRGTQTAHLINLIKFLLTTRLHSCPGVQFHSPHPGQVSAARAEQGKGDLLLETTNPAHNKDEEEPGSSSVERGKYWYLHHGIAAVIPIIQHSP